MSLLSSNVKQTYPQKSTHTIPLITSSLRIWLAINGKWENANFGLVLTYQ